jgi:GT2 family glycosyltransferase
LIDHEPARPISGEPCPDLSILVVTHNGRTRALETLESARASLGNVTAEWLIVDCGSSDGTPDAIEETWDDVHVIRRTNIGFAAGNNVGLSEATGRYVLLLNPDVVVTDGTFEDLVRAMDSRPRVGAASVLQRAPAGELLPSIRRFPSPLRQAAEALMVSRWRLLQGLQEREVRADRYETEGSSDWLVGAFLVVRSEAMAEIGFLDERFFLYSEETDWCFRLRAAGWDVRHLPMMTVLHHQGRYQRPELAAQLAYSKMLFATKHYPPTAALAMRLALALGYVLRLPVSATLGLIQPRWRIRARGELRALRVLLGVAQAHVPRG